MKRRAQALNASSDAVDYNDDFLEEYRTRTSRPHEARRAMPRRGRGTRGAGRGRCHGRGVRELNRPLVSSDELCEFELERQQRIAQNMVRMEQHYSDLPMFHLPTDPLFRHVGNMGGYNLYNIVTIMSCTTNRQCKYK